MITSLIIFFIHSSLIFSTVIAENYSSSARQDDNCVLPPYPEHGRYTVSNYPSATPGESYPSVKLEVSCDTGYQNENATNSIFCVNGEWSATMPACVRFCTLVNDLCVEYRSELSDRKSLEGSRECESLVPSGTVVSPKCRYPHYFSPIDLAQMHCIDGNWNYKAICNPICGILSPFVDLVGTSNNHVGLPWYAAIYRKVFNPYNQICGGSLITANKIISAAHCFWSYTESKLLPASNFAVAVGKVYRPYNEPHDINSQQSNVVDIKIPSRFQGGAINYQDDIAIVIVETPFTFQLSVRPVCLDFDNNLVRNQLTVGNNGKAASWNNSGKKHQLSPVLKIVDLPYINIEDCLNISPPDFRQYISNDKFCAGSNGTSLCRGDSGNGLAFLEPTTQRYYLRGVLSVSPTNEDVCDSFNTFTSIIKHEHFIKQYL